MGRLAVLTLVAALSGCGRDALERTVPASDASCQSHVPRSRPDAGGPPEAVFLNCSRTTESQTTNDGVFWTYDVSLTFENLGTATRAWLEILCVPDPESTGRVMAVAFHQELPPGVSTVPVPDATFAHQCSTMRLRAHPKTPGDWVTVDADLPVTR